MATYTEIREALAVNLAAITGVQVSAYMLANPTPPTIHVVPGEIFYKRAMNSGMVEYNFKVQALVSLNTDIGSQKKMDPMLEPSGPRSITAALESDKTLGGKVFDLSVDTCSGYQTYPIEGRPPVLGAEWLVRVYANGS